MSSYRTRHRAVVHPLNGKPVQPFANLDYKDSRELVAQLTTYLRGLWPAPQKIQIDVAARKILVNGVERAAYELVAPAAVKKSSAVMF
ncbi:hypothetical protein [Arthrobacter sp. SDTb3-6]|uniref:hypothetical protein n=1 Tax=Arthrobacter sp. SDTb3-6 TaxID=2713571 RepID=UPI00159E1413|nr:hypothetical protein [Arthrobacter sp. SDTb3-6]NVM97803.1 hypothetical protein [Arthrobacter sp. SDTb3-6]